MLFAMNLLHNMDMFTNVSGVMVMVAKASTVASLIETAQVTLVAWPRNPRMLHGGG